MSMRRDPATAVILFTGDVRREERRKQLPPRLLATVHAGIAREVRRAGSCDLFIAGSAPALANVAGTFAAGSRPLAEQVATALATLFAGGYERVLVLAGDVAALHARHIAAATRQLRDGEPRAVVGPCRDGGFYLAGFNRQPNVDWEALPWFGARIAAELSAALARDGFALAGLETLDDIDDPGDARRAAADRTFRLRAALLSLLGAMHRSFTVRIAPVRRFALTVAMRRRPPPLAG